MSKPVEELEISALIDGELDAVRATEVRSAVQRDPSLQSQFTHLTEADRVWITAAESAQFTPVIPRLELGRPRSWVYMWIILLLTVILVAGRCFSKLATVQLLAGMLIHALMLAVVVAVVVWISRSDCLEFQVKIVDFHG